MTLRRTTPVRFQPHGVSDTLDGSNVFRGACATLENLIPDPSTADVWMCRPAAIELLGALGSPFSSGFSSGFGPISGSDAFGVVSVLLGIGTRIYGMVGTVVDGFNVDAPFCFDAATNTTVVITGTTDPADLPRSLPTTGDWIPPTMTLVGTKIVVCHQGFVAPKYVGFLDTADPNALVWTAGNLTGAVAFTSPPYACGQFNGRAWYLHNPSGGQPAAIFSDALVPGTVTNASQVLFFGDNQLLTATIGLPLNNQLGGIIQSLLVFKGAANIFQITGDATTGDLALNSLNAATGTLAPKSLATTTKGVVFVAPDGLRLIDFLARVSDPIGFGGSGVNVPLINALHPSRIAGDFNANIYRVSLQNGAAVGSPNQEFWFDFSRQIWSGPHTLPMAVITHYNNTFVGQPVSLPRKLFQSDVVQSSSSTFVENGVQMSFSFATSMLPDTDQMCENAMVETTIFLAFGPDAQYAFSAVDQNGVVFDSILLVVSAGTTTRWGQFQWGQAVWGGAQSALFPIPIDWHYPIVFRRLACTLQGNCSAAFRLGTLHLRYEALGYLQQAVNA